MRATLKIIAVACGLIFIGYGYPAMASNRTFPSSPDLSANFPDIKISEFKKLSVKDFSRAIGKKLNLKERIAFYLLKKSMKKSLKSHPDQMVKDFLATTHKKSISKTLAIVLVLLGVLVMVILIVLSTKNISFGGG